jgi:hypothetical protein
MDMIFMIVMTIMVNIDHDGHKDLYVHNGHAGYDIGGVHDEQHGPDYIRWTWSNTC